MHEIRHQLRIHAAPDRVYEAIATREGLASWWTRDARTTAELGDIAEFGFDGGGVVFRMRVVDLDPPHGVHWHCIGGHPEWEGTDINFTITPDGEDTILDFGHVGWQTADGILPASSYDWAGHLWSLKRYLETGEGAPRPG